MFVTWRAPRRPRAPGSRRDPRRPGDDEPSAVPSQSGVPNDTNRHQSTEDGTMRGHLVQHGQPLLRRRLRRHRPGHRQGAPPLASPPATTRKGAEKMLGDLVKRMHDGDYRSPDKITLGDYLLERWLPSKTDAGASRRRPRRTRTTSSSTSTRNIGRIPLQKLQPEDLDDALREAAHRRASATAPAAGSSPKSVRIVHATIQGARPTPTARAPSSATSPTSPTRRRLRVGGSRR